VASFAKKKNEVRAAGRLYLLSSSTHAGSRAITCRVIARRHQFVDASHRCRGDAAVCASTLSIKCLLLITVS
jgi:hypothetical protein